MNTSDHDSDFINLHLPDGTIPYRLTKDSVFRAVLQSRVLTC